MIEAKCVCVCACLCVFVCMFLRLFGCACLCLCLRAYVRTWCWYWGVTALFSLPCSRSLNKEAPDGQKKRNFTGSRRDKPSDNDYYTHAPRSELTYFRISKHVNL